MWPLRKVKGELSSEVSAALFCEVFVVGGLFECATRGFHLLKTEVDGESFWGN